MSLNDASGHAAQRQMWPLMLAVGQFVFGAAQPVFGAIADKYGAVKVVVAGAIMLAVGCALTPLATSSVG